MKVAVYKAAGARYPETPPYDPPNAAYDAVRGALGLLGLDPANPLGAFIRPGDRVVIKPNLVTHEFGVQEGQRCLTAHGSVLRAVVDYAFLAGGPESSIVIADAPVQGADFAKIVAQNGLDAIRDFYWRTHRYELAVLDLRQVQAVLDEQSALIRRVEELPGDPRGYSIVDLGEESRLRALDRGRPRYAVGDYDEEVTNRRHRAPHHEYVIANTILDANTILSVPKLKTHSKVGLTMALKNMVGIVGSKDCLPHHRHGTTGQNGDEFPRDYPRRWLFAARGGQLLQGHVPRWMWRAMRTAASSVLGAGTPSRERRVEGETQQKFFPSGSWYGNDTIWRTVDDLNRILRHWSRATNRLEAEEQRRCFTIVDGIVSMEGNGPLKGSPRQTGVVLAGEDSLALDLAAASLVGFDWRKIPMLAGMAGGETGEVDVVTNVAELAREPHLPPAGWRNHVELH